MRDKPQRSHNHGPAIMVSEVPRAKSAMVAAPDKGSPDRDASSNAEYSKPQGNRDHTTPSPRGAANTPPAPTLRTLAQTLRAPACSHRG